jgi:hypothetical protein
MAILWLYYIGSEKRQNNHIYKYRRRGLKEAIKGLFRTYY